MTLSRPLPSIFALVFVLHSQSANAVEPTHVNFGAKRETEEAVVGEMEKLLSTELKGPQPDYTKVAVGFNALLAKLQDRKLSATTTDKIAQFYFQYSSPKTELLLFRNVAQLLMTSAHNGSVGPATLETILSRTPDGRLAEVVRAAFQQNPRLRTPELDEKIHQEFARIVKQAKFSRDVSYPILSLVKAEKVREMAPTLQRLKNFALEQDGGYLYILTGNRDLIPVLGHDFPVPHATDIYNAAAIQVDEEAKIEFGRPRPDLKSTVDLQSEARDKLRSSALAGSRDRVEWLFAESVTEASAFSNREERLRALTLLKQASDVDRDLFLASLKQMALAPGHDDNVRIAVMGALSESSQRHPELREVVLTAAGKLKMPSRFAKSVAVWLEKWQKERPLSKVEQDLANTFLSRPDLALDSAERAKVASVRRSLIQSVSPCPDAFKTLGH